MTPQITTQPAVKPSQYVPRFIGKVSWEGRANGLSPEIYGYIIYEGDNTAQINEILEAQSASFIHMQAMAVQKDQGKIIDIRQTPSDRMLVPFRWLVSMSCDIHKMVGELSNPDENGIERLSNGDEPAKQ